MLRTAIILIFILQIIIACNMHEENQNFNELLLESFQLNVDTFESEHDGTKDTIVLREYVAKTSLYKNTISVSFDADDISVKPDSFLINLNKNLSWIHSNEKVINDEIINELLDLKNSSWLDEGEKPLSKDQFLNKIKLTDMRFFSDHSYEMYYDDGDIFWGHVILVRVSGDNEIEEITIAG